MAPTEAAGRYLHEQAGLSTGAVADNDELSTDLRHGFWFQGGGWREEFGVEVGVVRRVAGRVEVVWVGGSEVEDGEMGCGCDRSSFALGLGAGCREAGALTLRLCDCNARASWPLVGRGRRRWAIVAGACAARSDGSL